MFICETVAAHPGRVTLLALASLTNVAMAMKHDPTLAGNLVRRAAVRGRAHTACGMPCCWAVLHGSPALQTLAMCCSAADRRRGCRPLNFLLLAAAVLVLDQRQRAAL